MKKFEISGELAHKISDLIDAEQQVLVDKIKQLEFARKQLNPLTKNGTAKPAKKKKKAKAAKKPAKKIGKKSKKSKAKWSDIITSALGNKKMNVGELKDEITKKHPAYKKKLGGIYTALNLHPSLNKVQSEKGLIYSVK